MIEQSILDLATQWAQNPEFSQDFRTEIQALLDKQDYKELKDRFYKELEFGTGGIRGVVAAGSNRMNGYNIRKVTQGLSNYLHSLSPKEAPHEKRSKLSVVIERSQLSVVIGYDSRLSSYDFAQITAQTLAANHIQVLIFPKVAPTPLVSFAIRYFKANAGIVITASHNPPEYNGYKVSWQDGAQVTAPDDKGIIDEVHKVQRLDQTKILDWQTAVEQRWIQTISDDLLSAYCAEVDRLTEPFFSDQTDSEHFSQQICYTPLHGVGSWYIEQLFHHQGLKKFDTVANQREPDGTFPTLNSPNPENESAFEQAKKIAADQHRILIATDPDADRFGIMLKSDARAQGLFAETDLNAKWCKLSGNQIGQILLYSWLKLHQQNNCLPDTSFVVSTIVSASLGEKIAAHFGVKYYETLTGFKNINRLLEEKQSQGEKYLFGYEESFGYQFGDFVREKDAICGSLLFVKIAQHYAKQGKDMLDCLAEIYQIFGFHCDQLVDKVFTGFDGVQTIRQLMKTLRHNAPDTIGGVKVVRLKDYLHLQDHTLGQEPKPLAPELKTDAIALFLENNTRITARPSGTEPKIKFYFNYSAKTNEEIVDFYQNCPQNFLKQLNLE